jgi:sterol desaturase/sphingolipid hydroxylase (fatty acid hydroxylase superfamily)
MGGNWWWLADALRSGAGMAAGDAWERWGCAATVLGIQFAVVTSLLTGLDLFNPPCWRRMILRSTRQESIPVVTVRRVARMMPIVIRNMAASAFYVWMLWNLRIAVNPARPLLSASLDSHLWFPISWLVQLVLIHWMSQLWFWSAHRTVHSLPAVYKFVHASHHVYSEPFALTAVDCTVSEMLILNMPAVIFPLLILQPSLPVQCIWVVLAASHVPLTHSGHLVAGGAAADAYHALHHRYSNCNFGSAWLDKIAGTFREEFRLDS